jgi:HK97 family phage portal protein
MAAPKQTRKPRKKQSLAPQTSPADVDRAPQFIFVRSSAGVRVNEDTALTQSAVWACIRVISETLAGMPWRVARKLHDGTHDLLPDHELNWILDIDSNPETRSFAFRETLWAWALGWGNGFAEIERNVAGKPVALWQIHPSRVQMRRDEYGRLVYEVDNHNDSPSYLYQNDMFHLMGPSPDGLMGWSVIRMHARTIGLAIAQEETAASFNGNDSTPGGILTTPKQLSEPARENLQKSWEARHQGSVNRRRVAILEEDLKWQQTGLPPEEVQLIEQMQLTPAMICRIFRVPPHKIADLSRSTNNNIEHQDIEFVNDTLRPWAERGEGEADVKLFGRNNQGKLITVIDMGERIRGDTAARTAHVKDMVDRGLYSINDGLRYLGLPGIGPDGDKRFVPLNMQLLEDAGKVPPPAKAPPTIEPEAETEEKSEPQKESMSRLESACLAVLEDACRRILAREKANQHLTGDDLLKWVVKHREYCLKNLTAGVQMLAELHGNGAQTVVNAAVLAWLNTHLEDEAGSSTSEEESTRLRNSVVAALAATAA